MLIRMTAAALAFLFLAGPLQAVSPKVERGRAAYLKEDFKKAFSLFLDEAKKGDADAQYMVAFMYSEEQGVTGTSKERLKQSKKWHHKAAKQGHPRSQFWLGFFHYTTNKKKALRWIKKSAEQDYLEAIYHTGTLYMLMRKDTLALPWLTKAAKRGHTPSMDSLSVLLGGGTSYGSKDRDLAASFRWARDSAGIGSAHGAYFTARNYEFGDGVPPDAKKAVAWYTVAAERGDPGAMKILGDLFKEGRRLGVQRNEYQASLWYEKAARGGNRASAYVLAKMLYDGDGISRDRTRAYEFFKMAAEQGHASAAYFTAKYHAEGLAPATDDPVEAYVWYVISSGEKGSVTERPMETELSALAKRMPPGGLEKATARWKGFKAKTEYEMCQELKCPNYSDGHDYAPF